MTTLNLLNWFVSQDATLADKIAVGNIDGNAEHFIGVYAATSAGAQQRVCIGVPALTDSASFTVLVHWSNSPVQAEAKARELYNRLYAFTGTMDGVTVYYCDPGAQPISVGKDANGICEFVINVRITYEKE